MSVSHILGVKGRNVITGTAKETVQSIAQKLTQHRIGAVVIVDDKGSIAGIVSERDIVRALAEQGEKSMAMPVSGVMSNRAGSRYIRVLTRNFMAVSSMVYLSRITPPCLEGFRRIIEDARCITH